MKELVRVLERLALLYLRICLHTKRSHFSLLVFTLALGRSSFQKLGRSLSGCMSLCCRTCHQNDLQRHGHEWDPAFGQFWFTKVCNSEGNITHPICCLDPIVLPGCSWMQGICEQVLCAEKASHRESSTCYRFLTIAAIVYLFPAGAFSFSIILNTAKSSLSTLFLE